MSNVCPCPNPPGGQIVCEKNQFAMCSWRDGKKVGGCLNIPSSISAMTNRQERNLAAVNFILSHLTGETRDAARPLIMSELDLLRSGRHTQHDAQVRFSLPQSIDLDEIQVVGVAAV